MLAQDIVNASSTDFRSVLASSAPDSTLFLSWVDRVQKDALHTGLYNYLINTTGTVSVVSGTSQYTLIPNLVSNADTWVLGTGWYGTFAGGFAQPGGNATTVHDASWTPVVGNSYQITFTLSGVIGGALTPSVGGVIGNAYSAGGTYSWFTGPLLNSTSSLSFASNTAFGGTVSAINVTLNGSIRRIQLVYDRTFDRVILPIESLIYPTNLGSAESPRQPLQMPVEMVTAELQTQYPKYFRLEGSTTLYLFPAPQKSAFDGTYEVHYEFQAPDVTSLTGVLLIPDDGLDMMVAGVNQYVAQFLHLDTESQFWSQQYEAYKKGSATV
jgi:hypothetical protein